ncbi:hypothetical protein BZM27_35590 [Paraburkholderia steynii]|uniref:Uncharacterized protein n=1 Tax=Paraburkholderia steynii TaxID=1245441 RepID=A0A4R0XBY4_9BURK|nr:hypothetical protein BZM27_35590 [Paraburkholderia steynii]
MGSQIISGNRTCNTEDDRPTHLCRRVVHEPRRATNEAGPMLRKPAPTLLRQDVDISAHRIDEHYFAHAFEVCNAYRKQVLASDL